MDNRVVMGIDVGTTATKTILVSQSGKVIAEPSAEYPLSMPRPLWYEQDPENWWQALKTTVRKVLDSLETQPEILGIGFSGQMHGMVALDKENQVVRPCIIWADQRNTRQLDEIYDMVGGVQGLLKYTNNRMLAGYTGGKILWFKENEPDLYARTQIILLPKDYIRFRLTGEFATEVSDASGTGLLDVRQRVWSTSLIDRLGLKPSMMPRCYESTEVSGFISRMAAEELGTPAGIPVVGGGGDAVIAMTGAGIIHEGEFGISLGTGGVVATALDQPYDNPDGILQVSCNNVPGKWHVMGVTMGAGGAFRWIKEAIGQLEKEMAGLSAEDVYDILCREAALIPAGSDGLLFLPHLFGSRCPHDDARSRGAYVGLTFQHNKGHLLRSVLEGVAFSFREMAEVISRMGVSPTTIRASGGGARSDLWRQIMADVFNCEVVTVSGSVHGGAYGAALVAGGATGMWTSVDEATKVIKVETRNTPVSGPAAEYQRLFPIFKGIYPQLKDSMHQLWTVEN